MTPAVSEEMVERAVATWYGADDALGSDEVMRGILEAALSTLAPSAAPSDLDEAHEQIRDLTKVITELGGIVYAPGEPLTTWKARAEKAEAALAARDEWRACATEFKELCSEWEARVTALEKALEPFGKWLDALDAHGFAGEPDSTIAGGFYGCTVNFSDLRAARAALLSAKGGET
jgi:hypothetical protein